MPLLAIALEFIGRGPAALTVEAVENYRVSAVKILEHLRPVIERKAEATLAAWMIKSATSSARCRLSLFLTDVNATGKHWTNDNWAFGLATSRRVGDAAGAVEAKDSAGS